VAIATLDRPAGLLRCLHAVLAGAAAPAEVIVVDQSAGDETEAPLAGCSPSEIPVVYVRQARRGLAASRNAALARARYPLVAVTDDDCVPSAGWVAALGRAFAAAPTPDAVTGRVLPLGPPVAGLYAVSSRTSAAPADYRGMASPWLVGTGANFAVRRECLSRVGGYDERLGVGSPGGAGEDIELLYRLLRAGARIRYAPDALVYHARQDRRRRLASRWGYGQGIGAFTGVWMRRGDAGASRVLARWVLDRGRRLALAAAQRRWDAAREELLVLGGTGSGLAYGLRQRPRQLSAPATRAGESAEEFWSHESSGRRSSDGSTAPPRRA